ncbi:GtrA family protein [Salinarimonas rosea]|uniref:GtrA family protein n=1 Tax=Salinarimonas rosea TaxID=552063 RepID=UPI000406CF49|nr:GtrA family protein [Salinarimonas rosea]
MRDAIAAAAGRLARTPLVRLLAVGGTSTGLYLALAFAGEARLGLPAAAASIGAYAVAAVFSYLAHRGFTFRSRRPHREAAWRFSLLTAAGWGAALAIPVVLTGAFGAPPLASFLVVAIAIPAANALALSRLVFARALTTPHSR